MGSKVLEILFGIIFILTGIVFENAHPFINTGKPFDGDAFLLLEGNTIKATDIPRHIETKTLGAILSEVKEEAKEEIVCKYPKQNKVYGFCIDDIMYSVLVCESNLDQSSRGKAGEIGIAQFMPKTWKRFNKERGTNLDIYSAEDQIDLMLWAFENNYQNHWTCFNKLYAKRSL